MQCYWSRQQGNGTISWLDAELTPRGVTQVTAVNAFWRNALSSAKIPIPQSFYVSPMARCLSTANRTWSDLPIWNGQPFSPVIKEVRTLRPLRRA